MNKLTPYFSRFFWLFGWIMEVLTEKNELASLAKWAKRKRLNKCQRAYELRLKHLDDWLTSVRVHNQGQVILCEFLCTAYQQIKPAHK